MVQFNTLKHLEWRVITLLPLTNNPILFLSLLCWGYPHQNPSCIRSLNQVWVQPQPPYITPQVVEVLQLPIRTSTFGPFCDGCFDAYATLCR
jgi:hypothetical protein